MLNHLINDLLSATIVLQLWIEILSLFFEFHERFIEFLEGDKTLLWLFSEINHIISVFKNLANLRTIFLGACRIVIVDRDFEVGVRMVDVMMVVDESTALCFFLGEKVAKVRVLSRTIISLHSLFHIPLFGQKQLKTFLNRVRSHVRQFYFSHGWILIVWELQCVVCSQNYLGY